MTMRWWGWGEDEPRRLRARRGSGLVGGRVGGAGRAPPGGPSRSTSCVWGGSARLPGAIRERFGEDPCATTARRACCTMRGKSYPDLGERSGDCTGAPDAVLTPRDHDEVRAVLGERGVHGRRGRGRAVRGRDERRRWPRAAARRLRRPGLARPRGARRVGEPRRALAGGRRGRREWVVELEARLGERGFTLGHYPQSYEYVTIGGCAATRSAGQASTGYGRIDELVVGARLRRAGRRSRPARPAGERGGSRAAPDGRRLRGRARGRSPAVAVRVGPTPGGDPLRGLDAGASAPGLKRCGAWSRAARRPTWRGSPTRPRRGWGSG